MDGVFSKGYRTTNLIFQLNQTNEPIVMLRILRNAHKCVIDIPS